MAPEDILRLIATAITRFGAFAAHALLFGAVPILLLVLRPTFAGLPVDAWESGRRRASGRLGGLIAAALVLSALCTIVVLLLQASLSAEVVEGRVTLESFTGVLETPFGRWHLLRIPVLIGLAVILWGRVEEWALARPGDKPGTASRGWWAAWLLLAGTLLVTTALSGHSAVASPRVLAQLNDIVHLIAGATWFCGVLALAVLVPNAWSGMGESDRLALLTPAVVRFSRVAPVAIGLVTLTGIVNSLLHVEALGDLTGTAYGRSLFVKLVFFVGVLMIGGINHVVLRERLQRADRDTGATDARRLFRRTIAVEFALGLAIFGATAVLTGAARTKDLPPTSVSTEV